MVGACAGSRKGSSLGEAEVNEMCWKNSFRSAGEEERSWRQLLGLLYICNTTEFNLYVLLHPTNIVVRLRASSTLYCRQTGFNMSRRAKIGIRSQRPVLINIWQGKGGVV